MNNILLIIAGLMLLAIVIHAYNMGWDAGHASGHEHEEQEPPEVKGLWK